MDIKHQALMAVFSVFLLLSMEVVAGANEAFETLLAVKSLKCSFGPGATGNWGQRSLKVEKTTGDLLMHFDSIAVKVGKARFIGNQGASDVGLLFTPAGITFIEQTGFGNLVFTTVFASHPVGSKDFIAVTSRHMLMPGVPLPSQYHGTCEILE